MKLNYSAFRLVIIIFLLLMGLILFFSNWLRAKGFDTSVLIWANVFLFCLHSLVILLQYKALHNSNPNVFIRSVLGGMIIKMFASVILILIYTVSSGENFNKRSVFLGMLLYLVYLGAEVAAISRMNKRRNA